MIWYLRNFELDVPFIPFYFRIIFFSSELWLPLVPNLHLKNVVPGSNIQFQQEALH